MKILLSPRIAERTNFKEKLISLGVAYTADPDEEGITQVLQLTAQEPPMIFKTMEQVIQCVEGHGGNSTSFMAEYLNTPGNEDYQDKFLLSEKLVAVGLSTIPTILPKTIEEMKDFFAVHGSIFCKPRIGSGNASPSRSVVDILLPTASLALDPEYIKYLESIPMPDINLTTKSTYFYKKFSSYEEFAENVDVNAFLTVQNSPRGLRIHQCIFQEFCDINANNQIYVDGFVNGESKIHAQRVTPAWYYTSAGGRTPESLIDRSLVSNIDDPEMIEWIKNAVQLLQIKNTAITLGIHKHVTGEWCIHDGSSRSGIFVGRNWSNDQCILDILKFMHSEVDTITITDDNFHAYFNVLILSPTQEIIDAAKELKFQWVRPITLTAINHSVGIADYSYGVRFFGTSRDEMVSNVEQFLAISGVNLVTSYYK